MRFGAIGKAWFGFLFAQFVLDFHRREVESKQRRAQFHGFTWGQVRQVIDRCLAARPDIARELDALDEGRRNGVVTGFFLCSPEKFRGYFGFDRPPPGAA